jgi:hypothetical protein
MPRKGAKIGPRERFASCFSRHRSISRDQTARIIELFRPSLAALKTISGFTSSVGIALKITVQFPAKLRRSILVQCAVEHAVAECISWWAFLDFPMTPNTCSPTGAGSIKLRLKTQLKSLFGVSAFH